jgi:sugar-specific transcriptional regulator TrmB
MSSASAAKDTTNLYGAGRVNVIVQELNEFGLSQKESQLYAYLLKYGPKRAGDLARSLKTYRLDVYRVLTNLIRKEFVTKEIASPAVYTAVDLAEGLETLLASRLGELSQLESIKSSLLRLVSSSQAFAARELLTSKTLANNSEFIEQLSTLGLSQKESQLYAYLLKYGPKRAGDLARSLETYRGYVYRRCARLADQGVIEKSTDGSACYAPVELRKVLNAALRDRKQEFRRLQKLKHTLVERSTILNGEPDGFSTSKVLGTVGEVIPAISQLINSAETSIVFAAQPGFTLISMGGFLRHLTCAVGRDVRVRGVLDISLQNIVVGHGYVRSGVELRHVHPYRGSTMVVADGTQSVNVIHSDMKGAFSLDEKMTATWDNSPAEAEFLSSAFEMTWKRAAGAEERINELLEQCHN